MQNVEERQRLVDQYRSEPLSPLAAVLKSAAGIFILVVIAASPWLLLNSNAAKTAADQPAFQAARAFPSVAESRRIFEERRQRYQAARGGVLTGASGEMTAPGQPSSGTVATFPNSMAESKRLFEERRQLAQESKAGSSPEPKPE